MNLFIRIAECMHDFVCRDIILIKKDNNEILCKRSEYTMHGKLMNSNYLTKKFYSKNEIRKYNISYVPYEYCGTDTEKTMTFRTKELANEFLEKKMHGQRKDFYVTRVNDLDLPK